MGGRAFAILDVANVRHEIGSLEGRPGKQSELYVASVLRVLAARNYEVTGLAVSLPILVVSEVPEADSTVAANLTKRSRDWVQREATKNKFEVMQGGIDGNREIGVDDLIVVRTLIEAEAIRMNPQRRDEKILILSHDSDLRHLAQFAEGVQVRIVGHEARFNEQQMNARQIEYEGISRQEMLACAVNDGQYPLPTTQHLAQRRRVEPLAAPLVVASPTVVVVDGYGLACSAASALGIAELPNAESGRTCLENLGFVGVNSIQFVLPDVNIKVPPRADTSKLTSYEKSAWTARDNELDKLAVELKTDNDPGTEVVRGFLAPAHIPDEARVDPLRQESLRHVKQHSTLLTATTVRQWLHAGATDVVVITDVPDVVLALDYLMQKFGHLRDTRLIRVGTRARPVLAARGGRNFRLPYFVLTEGRLAQLVRVHGQVGRNLRSAIQLSATSQGILHEEWQVVAFEPEVRGYRVQSRSRPDVEVVIMDAERLGLRADQVVNGAELNLAIYANRSRPVDPLVIVAGASGTEHAAGALIAEVASRNSDAIHFDLDGDGTPDIELPIGHDFQPVQPGSKAVLGYLHADISSLRYVAINESDESAVRSEVRVKVSKVTSSSVWVDVSGVSRQAHAIQRTPLVDLAEGDSVMAIDVGDDDTAHFVLLSSALGDSPLGA